MMGTAKYIGRVGALAVALGVGNLRRTATRMSVSIGVAALVVAATVVPAPVSTVSPAVKLSADSTALIMCGTTCPTPDASLVESVKNQFIAPTHPGEIDYVAVTTPEEFWPISGVFRLLGLALGPSSLFGLDGPAWPDEPWWKLSGLFDLSGDQSLRAGVADLEAAMADNPNDHQVIFGVSQGAGVANVEKGKLAEQYPVGTKAPDIDFVLTGDPNLPNGGLASRFAGLYIPILDLSFNGPARTDTQFDTVEINRQYDGFSDLPLYPLNGISLLNALLGIVYVHLYILDVGLPADPTKSPAYQGKYGDTSYYFFENQDLPLFGPLRTLGVPESLIDVVEPFFRVLVELGYDRTIPPWEPTPARLIPPLDPVTLVTDLANAIGEGINNAAALIGAPPPLSISAPVTLAAPAIEAAEDDVSPQVKATETLTRSEQVVSTKMPAGNAQISTDTALSNDVTETAESDEASTVPSNAGEPSASDDTPKAAKPTVRKATPRPVFRGSLGVGEQLPDLPHRGNDGRKTSQTDDNEAATAGSASVTSSSATESSSSDSASSDGDASGS
jgi:hypothetical protein